MNESITITDTGTYGIMTQCKYRLPCGYCELKKEICTVDNPITITPSWTMPLTSQTEVTCSAEGKAE